MKKIRTIIRIAAAVILYYFAVQSAGQVQGTDRIAMGFLKGQPLGIKDAEAIQEQNFCFWGEMPDAELTCRLTGQSASVTLVLTAGDSSLVMPGTDQLAWKQDGCYVDTDTARELFGTEEASGQIVWCNETAYTVRGTFDSLRRMMVRSAEDGDGSCLDAVSVRGSDRDKGKTELEQFLMRYGFSGECTDFVWLSATVQSLLVVLPLLLAVRLAGMIRGGQFAGVVRWILPAVILAGSLWFLAAYIRIPSDMIPTKWSDFSFWTAWWRQQRQNLLLLLGSAQGELQLGMLWNTMKSIVYNFSAVLCIASVDNIPQAENPY